MANYLPVLLVNLNAKVIPDDSSVATQPQSQVDYLSHEWQEEDVAKSWRSMTRQKNEIANGVRLENASWRTWWKQRNKLKTVTPETLNWLKDSDVTWLYGPLHTATDWTPPPKPKPIATSVDDPTKSSDTVSQLDLSTGSGFKQKSILKHRSISEILSCDFPSPSFTPPDSDGEPDGSKPPVPSSIANQHASHRPPLPHIKSDTHITRALRTESPPPADHSHQSHRKSDPPTNLPAAHSGARLADYFASASSRTSRKRTRTSPPLDDPTLRPSSVYDVALSTHGKKKHISFNTFVEQCIAIDKPKEDGVFQPTPQHHAPWKARKGSITSGGFLRPGALPKGWLDGSEDEGFGTSPIWSQVESAIETDSEESSSISEDASDDDMAIRMRLGNSQRSTSKASHSSSSSSATSSSASSTAGLRRGFRRISRSSRHSQSSSETRVTIAPMPPTTLKTHDESPEETKKAINWTENLGDDSQAYDDGYVWGGIRKQKSGSENPETTPVELVYVPSFGSGYDVDMQDVDDDETPLASRILPPGELTQPSQPNTISRTRSSENLQNIPSQRISSSHGVPSVVRTPAAVVADEEVQDAYDHFGGPDMDIQFNVRTRSNRTRPGYSRTSPTGRADLEDDSTPQEVEEGSHPIPVPKQTLPPSSSPASAERFLSPPERGRPMHTPSSSDPPSRGRSSTRTSSSSLSTDRSSPLGSLSPDGVVSPGGAYANGRRGERDRERSRERGRRSDSGNDRRERGRDRTSRSLSHSRSPSSLPTSSLDAAVASAQLDGFVDVQMPSPEPSTPTLRDVVVPGPPSPMKVDTSPPDPDALHAPIATPANSPVVGTYLPPYIKKGEANNTAKSRTISIGKPSSASKGSVNGGITKSKPVTGRKLGGAAVVSVSTSTTPPSMSEPSSPMINPSDYSSSMHKLGGHVRGGSTGSIGEGDGVVHKAVGLVSSYLGFWQDGDKIVSP